MLINSASGQVKQSASYAEEMFYIFGGSFLLALAAPISINLPFTPVPIVIQNTLALLLGILLGPKRAALSILLFLAQGAMGLPVFSNCGGGLSYFFSPRGGFLIGYFFGGLTSGIISTYLKTAHRDWIAMAIGSIVIYAFGVLGLTYFFDVKTAIKVGVLPFLSGNALKIIVFMQIVKPFRKRYSLQR